MKLPILYKLTSTKKVQEWCISTEDNAIIVIQGQVDGKKQRYSELISKGKNIGRANETTPEQQADAEAQAKWDKKHKKDYHLTIEDCKSKGKIANQGGYLPMLAQSYHKHAKKYLKYPCLIQPKLDGCFFRTTEIITDKGIKTIEEIVENKLQVKILSYNFKIKKTEFKSIVNWFNNGKINYKEWIEVNPKYGKFIKCTPNHLFYTNKGWKKAMDLNQKTDKIFNTNCNKYRNQLIAGTLLGDTCIAIEKRHKGTSYRIIFQHTNIDYFTFKVKTLNLEGKVKPVKTGYGSDALRFTSKALTQSDFPIGKFYTTGHNENVGKRKLLNYKTLIKYITIESLSLWISDDGNLSFNNKNKYTPMLTLATHGFSNEQIKHIVKYFKIKWNCIPNIYKDKRVKSNGEFLIFSTKDTLYLLNQLKDYKCKGMEYKYYFLDGSYLPTSDFDYKFTSFKIRKSHKLPKANKYDLEIEDNHNYFANGILVHNCRALSTKTEDGVKFWFRSGKEITTMGHIVKDLDSIMKVGDIFDGELYKHGGDFNTFTGAIRANKNLKPEIINQIKYHIYDFPRIDGLIEKDTYIKRLKKFKDLAITNTSIVYVRTLLVKSFEQSMNLYKQFIDEGYEGIMFRNINMPYEQKRSYNLLKYKIFLDDEFIIISGAEGKGILAGHIGSFICKIEANRILNDIGGKVVKFGDKDGIVCAKMDGKTSYLKHLFNHPDEYMGKPLTIKYQNLSKDGVPRFPIGKCIRFDK